VRQQNAVDIPVALRVVGGPRVVDFPVAPVQAGRGEGFSLQVAVNNLIQ